MSNFFFKKLNNVDYVLHIQDPDNESNINHIIARLREIDTVTAVFKIDLKIIKDKNFQYLIQLCMQKLYYNLSEEKLLNIITVTL